MTLIIVDLWQYCVCCICSSVTRCQLFMVLYLCRTCQRGLHAVLCSHIGILVSFLSAEPRSAAGRFFASQCPCETNLLTLDSMEWDWRVSRAGPMLFYWPKRRYPFSSSTIFPFPLFRSIGWYCGERVFGLIWCQSLAPSFALPTSFNNDKR